MACECTTDSTNRFIAGRSSAGRSIADRFSADRTSADRTIADRFSADRFPASHLPSLISSNRLPMDQSHIILAIFEFAVLLFSLSLHEAAHAWTANRLGDPTAKMLGRVTMNPIKHIDPFGTVILPLIMLVLNTGFLFGWAKPTPVTPRNFKKITRDDILTTVAGPASNLLLALASALVLLVLSHLTTKGMHIVHQIAYTGGPDPVLMATSRVLYPLALLSYLSMILNLILAAFNLLPLPPLDGSHVVRHMLPYKALRVYDSLGIVSLFIIFLVGGRVIGFIVGPPIDFLRRILLSF